MLITTDFFYTSACCICNYYCDDSGPIAIKKKQRKHAAIHQLIHLIPHSF